MSSSSEESARAADSSPTVPRFDLGVLLVHGIGQQVQGDTLVRCGEPIQRWLQQWIAGSSRAGSDDRVVITAARFAAPSRDAEAPAKAELDVKTASGRATWLLVESWWANSFLSPKFSELVTWGFQILPCTLNSHFATRARRVYREWSAARGFRRAVVSLKLAPEILYFLLAVLLFPLLVAALVLVLIVGLLPIPRVRSLAARLQRILSSTLGDSFVLVASPIQEAVIVGKVQRDLNWMIEQGCRRVAIVAHSQGAAIAHAVVRKMQPERNHQPADSAPKLLLVTVGSGLNKLAEIRNVRSTSKAGFIWGSTIGLVLLALALPELYASFVKDTDNFLQFMAVSVGLMLFMLGVGAAWKENRPEVEEVALGPGVRWIDLYACADPVPNGRMFDSEDTTRRVMEVHEVNNLRSLLFDHVTYFRNDDEFLNRLLVALCEHSSLPIIDNDSLDRSHLAVAIDRRRWRVYWLAFARLLMILLTAGIAVRYWADLPEEVLARLKKFGAAADWIPSVGELLKPLAEVDVIPQFVGAAVLAAFGITAYYMIYGFWAAWNRADVGAFFTRRPFAVACASFLFFVLALALIVEAFVLAFAGYSAGLVPGLTAALLAWTLAVIAVVMLILPVGAVLSVLGWLILNIRSAASWAIRKLRPQTATQQQSTEPDRRLIGWENPRFQQHFWLSYFVLIVLTFPYLTFVTASMAPDKLWVEDWLWKGHLLDLIHDHSRPYPISQWQWLSGALGIVLCVNVMAALGGFQRLYRWFVRSSQAGPIAVAHARSLPEDQAVKVLKRATSLAEQELAVWESALRKLREAEARSEKGKAEVPVDIRGKTHSLATGSADEKACERNLRAVADHACEIAENMPAGDPDAIRLLEHAARTSPEAALALAKRIDRSNPEAAAKHLRLHIQRPGWWMRYRIRRALAKA